MANLKVNNCSECPFLHLDDGGGFLYCKHPKVWPKPKTNKFLNGNPNRTLDFSDLAENQRDCFVEVIHEDCPLKIEPITISIN